MSARLPEEIERELWDSQTEIERLRATVDALPRVERYTTHRGNVYTVDDGGQGDSEDAAHEVKARRRELNAAIKSQESVIRSLRGEYRAMTSAWPVGCEDLAAMLGVQLATVHAWRKRDRLPQAAGMIGGAPWWWRSDVLNWARETKRVSRVLAYMADAA